MAFQRSVAEITDRIVHRVSRVEGVVAIVLGGSQARGTADSKSDVDLGIYYEPHHPFSIGQLSEAARELDDRHLPGLVTNFGEWGPGVNGGGWLLTLGRPVDFLYRDLDAVRTAVDDCLAGRVKAHYQIGHPMGFQNQIYLGELSSCRPLFDPCASVAKLKKRVAKYPAMLGQTLIRKHLFDAAFETEIARKPAERGDVMFVSGCLFRAAGFMTMTLYALNRRYWINEKGAFSESRRFGIRPPGFHSTVERVLANPGRKPAQLIRSIGVFGALAKKLGRAAKMDLAEPRWAR
ncbi:MAG TPA: nucleotidyltransferase domain-containing protein [Candidatus Binataceae bacterium]